MDEQEIEIEITAQGKVLVRTKGIKGAQCLEVAEFFARIVGREEARELTSEYYESSEVLQSRIEVHRRNG